MQRRKLLFVALLSSLAALPAASQQGKAPPVTLYVEALTHSMAGMPDMGGMMGGLAGMMARRNGGGDSGHTTYPTTRTGVTTGQYLDLALHNANKPGTEAADQIPAGLNLGRSLQLLPITEQRPDRATRPDSPREVSTEDMEIKIVEYWGCGAAVRPGQPKVTTIKIRGGTFDPSKGPMGMQGFGVQASGQVSRGISVADSTIGVRPGYVYWPNPRDGRKVPTGARLAGDHQISGDGIPASMHFQVSDASDFMAKIALRTQGELTDAVNLGWPTVAHSNAYFISAVGMQPLGEHAYQMTSWSSAEVPGAGAALHVSMSDNDVNGLLRRKVFLPATATSCVIPRGIFAGGGGRQSGMPAMLQMSAFGPETFITYPPKPANPKQAWNPEWSVRLRTRSTASAILGLDMGGMQNQDDDDQQQPQQQQQRRGMRGLLNGILGG